MLHLILNGVIVFKNVKQDLWNLKRFIYIKRVILAHQIPEKLEIGMGEVMPVQLLAHDLSNFLNIS
jgi:hypothetical protein